MTTDTNSRGSEWRKWDLHVHTPESLEHNFQKNSNNDNVWESYIKDLESLPDEIKVLGINDYIFLDGYKKILEYKSQGRLNNIDLILPVIELRLAKFCGHKQFVRVNYHVVFSNEIDACVIEQQFINALTSKYKLDPNCGQKTWGGVITKDNLRNLGASIKSTVPEEKLSNYGTDLIEGFNNLNLEVSNIEEALNNASQYFKGKYLTAIGKTEWDAFPWGDTSIAEKKTIINSADIIFTASENLENHKKGKNKLIESGVNSLLLDCSDAHTNSWNTTSKDRIGNCNTWIKADPTFEGLKQILYEPEARVRIQESKPEEKSVYQVIDSILLDKNEFWKGEIRLSENLNTIIGGRATGKSTLLQTIAKKINPLFEKTEAFIDNNLDGITINWKDGEISDKHDIDIFSQGYMFSIANNNEKTTKLINDILQGKEHYSLIEKYNSDNVDLDGIISSLVHNAFRLQSEIDSIKSTLKEKGDKIGIEKQIDILNNRIKDLSGSFLTEEERNTYQTNIKEIAEIEQEIETKKKDVIIVEDFKTKSIINLSYSDSFINLSSSTKFDIENIYNEIRTNVDAYWAQRIDEEKTNLLRIIDTNRAKEETIKQSELFKKCFEYYEKNKELNDVHEKIKIETTKLNDIIKIEKQLNDKIKLRKQIESQIIDSHKLYKNNIDNLSTELKIDHDNVSINAVVSYNPNDMQQFLEQRLSLKGRERQEYIKKLSEQYENDIENQCRNFLSKALNNDIEYKNSYDSKAVVSEFFAKNWFSYSFDLIYQNDSFAAMSPGKKAFVILKLLLEFSDKKCPILIDQPEDSLDNRAIYNELVQYIRTMKTERQIILVTHNPNIVVGADAENVIVANQHGDKNENRDGYKFQYINGSLENITPIDKNSNFVLEKKSIREHVCEILEGGEEAFQKREQKYNL